MSLHRPRPPAHRQRRVFAAFTGPATLRLALRIGCICVPLALASSGCGEDTEVEAKTTDVSSSADVPAGDIAADTTNTSAAGVVATSKGETTGPRVELEGVVEADDTVTVRILVRGYPELYAIASHLTWDPAALQLLEHKSHLMMQGSGYGSRTLVKPADKGVLLLGAARFKDGGSPWSAIQPAKVGNELWATLRVKLLGDKAELTFDADHSLAKDAAYKAVKTGWQQLTIARTVTGGGQ